MSAVCFLKIVTMKAIHTLHVAINDVAGERVYHTCEIFFVNFWDIILLPV